MVLARFVHLSEEKKLACTSLFWLDLCLDWIQAPVASFKDMQRFASIFSLIISILLSHFHDKVEFILYFHSIFSLFYFFIILAYFMKIFFHWENFIMFSIVMSEIYILFVSYLILLGCSYWFFLFFYNFHFQENFLRNLEFNLLPLLMNSLNFYLINKILCELLAAARMFNNNSKASYVFFASAQDTGYFFSYL